MKIMHKMWHVITTARRLTIVMLPSLHVTGDVTQERHLRDGWDGQCIPYGGDGNTKISALLHNA